MTSQQVEFTYKQMQINQVDQEEESVLLRTLEKDMHRIQAEQMQEKNCNSSCK